MKNYVRTREFKEKIDHGYVECLTSQFEQTPENYEEHFSAMMMGQRAIENNIYEMFFQIFQTDWKNLARLGEYTKRDIDLALRTAKTYTGKFCPICGREIEETEECICSIETEEIEERKEMENFYCYDENMTIEKFNKNSKECGCIAKCNDCKWSHELKHCYIEKKGGTIMTWTSESYSYRFADPANVFGRMFRKAFFALRMDM